MDFENRLKGTVTQTLVKALLEDAGYRTIALGVEEVIREVSVLDRGEYRDLALPTVLKRMPDFFVADSDLSKAWLLEVKYRKQWNAKTRESLGKQIREQVKIWHPLFLTVFLGNSTKPGNDSPIHSIGVIRLECENEKMFFVRRNGRNKKGTPVAWSDVEWSDFSRFQDVFEGVGDRWKDQTIMQTLDILRTLNGADLFEE